MTEKGRERESDGGWGGGECSGVVGGGYEDRCVRFQLQTVVQGSDASIFSNGDSQCPLRPRSLAQLR